jgi:hypothetical protein
MPKMRRALPVASAAVTGGSEWVGFWAATGAATAARTTAAVKVRTYMAVSFLRMLRERQIPATPTARLEERLRQP